MALAIRNALRSTKDADDVLIWQALWFGAVFLVIKYFEYAHKIHLGQLAGEILHFHRDRRDQSAYLLFNLFRDDRLHGIHVIGGMAVISAGCCIEQSK